MTEAEKGIIGCILTDSDSLYVVYENLKPEMFSNQFCRDCYTEMLSMYDRGEKINVVELSQRLEGREYDAATVGESLRECVIATPTSVMIKSYAEVVMKEHRSLTAKNLFQRISFEPKDIDDTISEVLARFEELQLNQEIKSKSMKQIVEENKDNYFKNVEKPIVKTGFYKLDDCLGGLEGGDITVIGARPAVGKSALVTQMIAQMANKRQRIGYFNLEMNESQVYERLVSQLASLSLTRVRRAKSFLGGEEEKFQRANEEMSKYDVIVSTGSKTVGEIRAESRHQRFDIIIIDYLQLVKAGRKYANRASEVGDISKSIKALAMELHVPIILLSQLNRVSEMKETKEPTMSELRESGDIEQDASNILLMWNLSERNHSFKGLKIEKQRMGELAKIGLKFNGDQMKFDERQENFDKFLSHAKKYDNDPDFENIDDTDTPFGEDW